MLKLSNAIIGQPVLSLRGGAQIATITAPLVNPDNLKIEGFYVRDRFEDEELLLLVQDIRAILPEGIAVDDHDILAEAEDLVRLKHIIDIDFEIIGKHVETVSKQKIGKVTDYAIEVDSMVIQKIYVGRSVFKSLNNGTLSIDRSYVQETTPNKIIISDLQATAPAPAGAVV